MDSQAIVVKTAKGVEEVETKKHGLLPRARTVLILVNGRKTVAELAGMAKQLGSPTTLLDEFLAQGLIELKMAAPSPAEAIERQMAGNERIPMDEHQRFRAAHKFMMDSAVNALGIKAFFFTLKLEKCSTRKDLLALLAAYNRAIAKGANAVEAELLTRHALEMLAD